MNDEMRASRTKRALEFGVLINGIIEREGKIPRSVLRQLAKYKRQFIASSNDRILGDLIRQHLLVLDEVVQYSRAHNAGNKTIAEYHRVNAERLWDEGDVIANKIVKEVDGLD